MSAHGTYETHEGRPAVRFVRRLGHPVQAVWRMVSEPGGLAAWFPCEVELEPRVGGAMRFTFSEDFVLDGEVLELDPPRLLAFRWGVDLVRLELAPAGDGASTLTLLHVLHEEGEDAAAKTMAGWHLCLDALARARSGNPPNPAAGPGGPTPQWQARYDEYVARGVPSGAPVPGLSS